MKRVPTVLFLFALTIGPLAFFIQAQDQDPREKIYKPPVQKDRLPQGKFRKGHPDAIPDQYIAILNENIPASEIDSIAAELAQIHGGKLGSVWKSALKGFSIKMSETAAIALSQDPRVDHVAEDVKISLLEKTDPSSVTVDPVLTVLGKPPADKAEYTTALLALLTAPDPVVRSQTAWRLGTPGLEAKVVVPALTEALKDRDVGVRTNAAHAVGVFGPEAKEAVPLLIQLLLDRYDGIRMNAAESLGEIGLEAKEAIPALMEALKDQSKGVRESASQALGKIRRN